MDEAKKKDKVKKDDALKLALNLFPNHNIQINPPPQTHRLPSFGDHREFSAVLPNLSANKPSTLPNLIVGRKNEKKEEQVVPNFPTKPKEEKEEKPNPKKRLPKKPVLKQTSGVFRGVDSNISQVRFGKVLDIKSDSSLSHKRGINSSNGKAQKDNDGTKHDEMEDTEDLYDLPVPLMCIKDSARNHETPQPENNFLSIITGKGNEKPPIMVIKFPQFLPLLIDKKPDAKNKQTLVTNLDGNSSLSGYRASIKDLGPGQIGKVIVYKSGKAVLRLGDCSFILDTAICPSFAEEVAKINVDPKLKCGNLFNLGKVTHRLVATPDFSNVLFKKEGTKLIKNEGEMELSGSGSSK